MKDPTSSLPIYKKQKENDEQPLRKDTPPKIVWPPHVYRKKKLNRYLLSPRFEEKPHASRHPALRFHAASKVVCAIALTEHDIDFDTKIG